MIPAKSITNEQRAEFLRALDGSDVAVSDWEARFLGSFLGAYRDWEWFTAGRASSTDKMWMKYGDQIGRPFPIETRASLPKLQEADPDGCQFLIFNEQRRLVPCNESATKRRRNGFRYCENHAEQVERDLRRRGKAIELIPI